MPMIQCDLPRDVFERYGPAISQAIHEGLIQGLEMPADDLFQIFRPHEPGEIVFSPTYGGVDRRALILVRITMVRMFTAETKQRMYREVVSRLEAVGLRHEDILLCVLETGNDDWYAGSEL